MSQITLRFNPVFTYQSAISIYHFPCYFFFIALFPVAISPSVAVASHRFHLSHASSPLYLHDCSSNSFWLAASDSEGIGFVFLRHSTRYRLHDFNLTWFV